MYYQNYEDYMRSILGYPIQLSNTNMSTYNNSANINYEYVTQTPRYSSEILDLYPEIYKILNPMVCKICESNTKPITRELVEQMTDEIYLNLESDPASLENDDVVNVRVNLPPEKNKNTTKSVVNDVKKGRENRAEDSTENSTENRENRQRRRNNTLRDLIRILILNQLLGGNVRPPRPMPPRPPYPGGGRPGNRPPMRPGYIF